MKPHEVAGVEHIAIASFTPRQLAEWYVVCLNFTIIHDTGDTLYLRAPNGVVLEFVQADTQPAPPAMRSAGLRHIALAVGDLDAGRAALETRGLSFPDEPILRPGLRLQFFRDPEGNFLHLVERMLPLESA
jgi:catechol-2,3-dioxygenase